MNFKDVGTHTIYYKITKDNYNMVAGQEAVIIDKRTAELAWTGQEERVYDGVASALSATVTNLGMGDALVTATVTGGDKINAGTYTAKATALDNENYQLPSQDTKGYTITRRPVKITALAITKIAGEEDPELTFEIVDSQTGTLPDSAEEIVTIGRLPGEQVGKYAIVITYNNPNYYVDYIGNYLFIKETEAIEVPEITGRIQGTITGGGTDTIVTLMYKGKIQGVSYGNTFDFVADDGVYNIIIESDGKSTVAQIEVKNGEMANINVDMTQISKSTTLEVSGDTMQNVAVDGMNNALDDVNSLLIIKLTEMPRPEVIESALTRKNVILTEFNMSAFADNSVVSIASLSGLLTLSTQLPEESVGRSIAVFRADSEATTADLIPVGIDNANEKGEYAEVDETSGLIKLHVKTPAYYTVSYVLPEYVITVTGASGGTISPGTSTVVFGDSKTFTITANSGYRLTDVLIDGTSVGPLTSYTFSDITDNGSITAIFTRISTGSGSNGSSGIVYTMPATPTPVAWVNPFNDVKTSDWFYSAVKFVNENGIMNGTAADIFEPQTTLTRAMFVTILHRMEGTPDTGNSTFADVDPNEYYAKAVSWAAACGIVYGISDTEFAPNQAITREQMATLMYRYAKFKGKDITGAKTNYSDNDLISDYAKEAIAFCSEKGIMQGTGDNIFDPTNNATRAETAAVVERFLEKQ